MMVTNTLAGLAFLCLVPGFVQNEESRYEPFEEDVLGFDDLGIDYATVSNLGIMYPPAEDEVVTVTAKFWYVSDLDNSDSVQDLVDGYIDKMNEALANSQVNIVYTQWGTIQDIGKNTDEVSTISEEPNRDFADVYVDSGLFEDEVASHAYIKQTADHMVLLTNEIYGNWGGKCVVFGPWEGSGKWDGNYYTIVVLGDLEYDLTFVHEAGHCLGAMHNEESGWETDNGNYGHCMNEDYSTVMTYEYTCEGADANDVSTWPARIPYYSNPDVEYCDDSGVCVATGTEEHNNAAYMNEQRWTKRDEGSNCNDGNPDENYEMPNSCAWNDWSEYGDWSDCCCDTSDTWDAESLAEHSVECTLWAAHYTTYDMFVFAGTNTKTRLSTRQCMNGEGEEVYSSFCDGDWDDMIDYESDWCSCEEETSELVGESAPCVELTNSIASSYEGSYQLQDYTVNDHYVWSDGSNSIYWYIGSWYSNGAWGFISNDDLVAEDTSSQSSQGKKPVLEGTDNPWDGDWMEKTTFNWDTYTFDYEFWWNIEKLDEC